MKFMRISIDGENYTDLLCLSALLIWRTFNILDAAFGPFRQGFGYFFAGINHIRKDSIDNILVCDSNMFSGSVEWIFASGNISRFGYGCQYD